MHSKLVIADIQNKNNVKTDLTDKKIDSNDLPIIDEEFLLFLAEVDIQNGVEVAPLDMLDVNLDSNNTSQEINAGSPKMKKLQEIDKTKENK